MRWARPGVVRVGVIEGNRGPRRRAASRHRRVMTAAAVAVPVCVLVVTSGVLGSYGSQVLDDGAQLAGALFATACCWSTWRRGGSAGRFAPARVWRLLLAVGIGGWACGQALWSWYQLVEGRLLPSPSLADVGYFTLPAFAAPAVLLLATSSPPADAPDGPAGGPGPPEPVPRVRRARLLLTLDALVIVGSMAVLAWSTVLGAVVRAGAPTAAEFAVAVAYPVTDLLLVVIVLLTAVFRRPRDPRVLLLLGAGLVALAASDSCFFYLVAIGAPHMPPLLDTGFIAGPVLIGLAALVPEPAPRAGARRRVRDPRWFVLLPYLPLGAIGLLVVVQRATGSEVDGVETAGLLVLAGVVVVRQLLTLLENLDLLRRVREGQERLQHQAFHDWLTGLPNRALFRHRLEQAVEAHRRTGRLAVLFVDLDDFKQVNDSLGHAAGDDLLKVTAQRLRAELADGDTAARLGGDEFAVVLAGAAAARRESAAAAGERLLAALGRPVVLAGSTVVPRVSAGLVVAEPGGPPLTAELVLHQADVAMYEAKRAGKGHVVTRSTTGDGAGEDLATRLGRALHGAPGQSGPLRLVHQPIVRLADGARVAVEALLRWEEDGEPVGPEVLVQAAETAGLAGRLQQWLFGEACRDVAALRANGDPRLGVHVNVPASLLAPGALAGGDLAAAVAPALAAHGLPGGALVLEVTETGRVDDFDAAAAVLDRVRALGVRVALDDFGAGHSNLTHLLRLPVDILKLDRALVAGIGGEGRARAVSGGAVQMARGLNIPIVAEGVEQPQQVVLLRELGCQYAQGYLFSPPLPAAQLSPSPAAAARPAAEDEERRAGDLQAVRAW